MLWDFRFDFFVLREKTGEPLLNALLHYMLLITEATYVDLNFPPSFTALRVFRTSLFCPQCP